MARRPAFAGRFRRRHLLVLALAAALPVLVFAMVVVTMFSREQRLNVETQLLQLARANSSAADIILTDRLATLQSLAVLARAGDDGDLRAQARRLLDAEGTDWLYFSFEGPGAPPLTEVRNGNSISPGLLQPGYGAPFGRQGVQAAIAVAQGLGGRQPVLVLRQPLRAGEPGGPAVVGALTPAALSAATDQPVPENWTAAVLTPEKIIAGRSRSPAEFIGTPATDSLAGQIDRSGSGFFFSRNKEGEVVYTAFARSRSTGWTSVVGAPLATIEGPLQRSRLALIGGAAAAVFLAGGFAWVLVGNIVRRQEAERRALEAEGEQRTERRLADIASHFPGVIYRRILHPDGSVSYPYLSSGAKGLLGISAEEASSRAAVETVIATCLDPQDQQRWREAIAASAQTLTTYDLDGRFRRPDGELKWLRSLASTHKGEDGSVIWDGIILDITDLKLAEEALQAKTVGLENEIAERKRVEEHQALLLAELNHRVRNTLAIVLSIAQQTSKHSDSLESFGRAFSGRIHALAQAHTLLSEANWTTTSLASLAEKAVAAHAGGQTERVRICGPDLLVAPRPAVAISLILHELATNAAKYGALSAPEGRISVEWGIAEDGATVCLTWKETGGPPAVQPKRVGFGSQLIELNTVHELGGTARRTYGPEGLAWEARFPASALGKG